MDSDLCLLDAGSTLSSVVTIKNASRLCQCPVGLGLPELANKNMGHPVKFEFQINCKHFLLWLNIHNIKMTI